MKDYIVKVLKDVQGDDLERAERCFAGFSPQQMQEQHGASGQTRKQVLDSYRKQRNLHARAIAFAENS